MYRLPSFWRNFIAKGARYENLRAVVQRRWLSHSSRPESVRRSSEASIHSARGGGMINDRPFVLIDAQDVPEAMVVLRKAGVRAVVE